MSRTHDIIVTPRRSSGVPRIPSKRTMDAATVARVMPRAVKDALDKSLPPVMDELARLGDALTRLDRAVDRRNARIVDAKARAIIERVRSDRAMTNGGLVSFTSGYIRDSAGNRVRAMTPADLNAIADKHYGRVR